MTSFHGLINTHRTLCRQEGGGKGLNKSHRKYTAWLSELRTILWHQANGLQPLPWRTPRGPVCGRDKSSRHMCNKPRYLQAWAGGVHSAVWTQRSGCLWPRRNSYSRWESCHWSYTWKNDSSIKVRAVRMTHRAQKGIRKVPRHGKKVNDKSWHGLMRV